MDIHNSIYGYPQLEVWISTNKFVRIQESEQLWISTIGIMDIQKCNCGYPQFIHGDPQFICGPPQLFMDIHNSIYGYPQLELWISTDTFVKSHKCGQLWISTIVFMDIYKCNCGYPQFICGDPQISTIMDIHNGNCGYPQLDL